MTDIRLREFHGDGVWRDDTGTIWVRQSELVDAVRAGVVAEEPEWEYGVKFDWKPEPSYVGSHDNCRYFMDQPNDSLEKHAHPEDTKTLLRRRKAGPWVPMKQEGADQ
ncbi:MULTISPECIES: hypothetical protein [Microbacterium]|uniref:hypothetical protein n=1 Tax=Microbacterium TaxID=33882 RepID=UPI0028E6A6B8|nr:MULTISPECIES: hypothetical protein [Microbacterium]